MEDFVVHGVLAEELPYVWEKVEPLIAKAVSHSKGRYSTKTIVDALLNRDMQLWIVLENNQVLGAGITEIIKFSTGLNMARMVTVSGKKFKEWREYAEGVISAWALEQGCQKMEGFGRTGLSRILKNKNGWRTVGVIMERDLEVSN